MARNINRNDVKNIVEEVEEEVIYFSVLYCTLLYCIKICHI